MSPASAPASASPIAVDRGRDHLAGRQLDVHLVADGQQVGVGDVEVDLDALVDGGDGDAGLAGGLTDGAADVGDANRCGQHDELAEVHDAVVGLAVVGLEVLDGLRRRARPLLVDGDVVILGVAERGQQVLELEHVLAVVDAGAERAPVREGAVDGEDRATVDLGDDGQRREGVPGRRAGR